MEFMEKLQKQKEEAKAAYIKARNEWKETITAENIKGDFGYKMITKEGAEKYSNLPVNNYNNFIEFLAL